MVDNIDFNVLSQLCYVYNIVGYGVADFNVVTETDDTE